MSKTKLHELTGINRHALIDFEEGRLKNPSLRQLLLLRKALGLSSIEDLLGDIDIAVQYPSKTYSIPD